MNIEAYEKKHQFLNDADSEDEKLFWRWNENHFAGYISFVIMNYEQDDEAEQDEEKEEEHQRIIMVCGV